MSEVDHSQCHRNRKLAAWALFAAFVETVALFFFEFPEAALWPSYGLWASIIVGHAGASVWDDITARRLGQR